ncbi:MAG: DUF935 family protein [Alistipes sp.]
MTKKKPIITTGGNVAINGQPRTIVLTAPHRGNVDIANYLASVRIAENVDWPKRVKLLDLYDDLLLTDGHLSAVVNKRKAAILNQKIEFARDGKVDEQIQQQLRSPWFFNFLSDVLDTTLYGNSLFQFYREGAWLNYDLVPRKHVDPLRRIICRHQSDLSGIPWADFDNLLFVGKERDLGLLAKIVPYAIYKRNCLADWAQYAELFGQPIREGEYDGWDDDARRKLTDDLFKLGSSPIYVHPIGTKLTLHESTQKSGSHELYNGLVTFCNEEESKIVLGNTLTTQASSTGTQALGTVQKKGEDALNNMDRQMVLNILNYDFADILTQFGFNTQGGEFSFAAPNNTDLASRIQIDVQLKNTFGLPISDDYLYEKYGVEKPADYEVIKARGTEPPTDSPQPSGEHTSEQRQEQKQERKLLNVLRNFFVHALDRTGASDW